MSSTLLKVLAPVCAYLPARDVLQLERVARAYRAGIPWADLCDRDFGTDGDIGPGWTPKLVYVQLLEQMRLQAICSHAPLPHLTRAVLVLRDDVTVDRQRGTLSIGAHARRVPVDVDLIVRTRRQLFRHVYAPLIGTCWQDRSQCTVVRVGDSTIDDVQAVTAAVSTFFRLCHYSAPPEPTTSLPKADGIVSAARRPRLTFSLVNITGNRIVDMWPGSTRVVELKADARNGAVPGLTSRSFPDAGAVREAIVRGLSAPSATIGHWVLQMRLHQWDDGRRRTTTTKFNFVHSAVGVDAVAATALAVCVRDAGAHRRAHALTRFLGDCLAPDNNARIAVVGVVPAHLGTDARKAVRVFRHVQMTAPRTGHAAVQ
ncbi:Uncharacterized protein PBTT_01017 [Plasmodiophora brassicae]